VPGFPRQEGISSVLEDYYYQQHSQQTYFKVFIFHNIQIYSIGDGSISALIISNIPAFLDNWRVFINIPAFALFQKWKSFPLKEIPALFCVFFSLSGEKWPNRAPAGSSDSGTEPSTRWPPDRVTLWHPLAWLVTLGMRGVRLSSRRMKNSWRLAEGTNPASKGGAKATSLRSGDYTIVRQFVGPPPKNLSQGRTANT
jgi:hypothetical protein